MPISMIIILSTAFFSPSTEPVKLSQLLYDYAYFLLYFSYFGFWQVVLDKEVRKENHYRAKSIELQPLLKQLAVALAEIWGSRIDEDSTVIQSNIITMVLLGIS